MSQPARSPGSFMLHGQNPNHQGSTSVNNFYSAAAAAAASNDLPPPPPRPGMRRVESSSSEESITLHLAKARSPTQQHHSQPPPHPPAPAFSTAHANSSATSLQNFSRPTLAPLSSAAAAARSVAGSYEQQQQQQQQQQHQQQRNVSPLPNRPGGHARKHSATAGVFEPTLPSISTSNLASHAGMPQQSPIARQSPIQRQSPVLRELSASHIAAQAAVLSHQQSQQSLHSRQRSLTAPMPGDGHDNFHPPKRTSGPQAPPALSVTEASAPRESGFGNQGYHNGLLGTNAASAAANAAFPRSGQTSPIAQLAPQPPPPPPPLPEKKPEKSSKVKLFSRPGKIGTKGDPKEKPLPSPSKIGSALSALQRGNFSTTSLDTHSFYNISNGSTATIRPGDGPEKEAKEKKHHFLSRQRHKTKDKDDYLTHLSSAASNSRPTDPSAPNSMYNFNLPSSPSTSSSTFKNISGLGHAGRTRKKEDKVDFHESVGNANDASGSLGSANTPMFLEPIDSAKYGLNSMQMDDAFPYLKSKLLNIFEGEDLRLPVEDFNRIVVLHTQYCIHRRAPNQLVDDLRELLWTGFSSLDHNLRTLSEDRLIPNLVELWLHVFTVVLPYMQAVFLPLDMEFAGVGSLMTPEQARDFFGGVVAQPPPDTAHGSIHLAPAATMLDVRRLVLTAYRDVVILPRYDKLKAVFSRLSLDFLPGLASPLPEPSFSTSPSAESLHSGFPFGTSYGGSAQPRPGTAMSLDPATASYPSTASTPLLGGEASTRSRGLSNVSFASSAGAHSDGLRPPKLLSAANGGHASLLLLREHNVEDSKYVTDLVGRILQCMSVLAGAAGTGAGDEGTKMVEELSRLLKLNWLGRGRTGRNRRGIVGGRVARRGAEGSREEIGVI